MKAVVLHQTGPAKSAFQIEERTVPKPEAGQALIRVAAFGLNHSELATRLGEPNPMGDVKLPRVLGIECVGTIESAPGAEQELPVRCVVMAALGGIGRMFDGSYAEFCVVPVAVVIRVATSESDCKLDWHILGALPEMLQTAHGCLFRSLRVSKEEKLLIRGATSSVGLAAVGLGTHAGAVVIASTRNAANKTMLEEAGADVVLVDNAGSIQDALKQQFPAGIDKILDLVGASTVLDSLRCLAEGGICCSAGTLGGEWAIRNFIPNFAIPAGRYLTSYGETTFKRENAPWDELLELVESGKVRIKLGKVYQGLESVIEAHEVMERNEGLGKLVVVL